MAKRLEFFKFKCKKLAEQAINKRQKYHEAIKEKERVKLSIFSEWGKELISIIAEGCQNGIEGVLEICLVNKKTSLII